MFVSMVYVPQLAQVWPTMMAHTAGDVKICRQGIDWPDCRDMSRRNFYLFYYDEACIMHLTPGMFHDFPKAVGV